MKLLAVAPRVALCLCLAASPVVAEDSDDGRSLMEEGVLLFFKGLQKEVEPALEELGALADEVGPALRSFTEEMGPALGQLLQEVEDWSAYHPPEILPNGDIIIRRKPNAEPQQQSPENGETDL